MHNLKAHANSQTAALRENKRILIPGDVSTDISRVSWSFQRDCHFPIWNSTEHDENQRRQPPRFNTRPSKLKATGKMIWSWEPHIALPFTLPSFSQSVFG